MEEGRETLAGFCDDLIILMNRDKKKTTHKSTLTEKSTPLPASPSSVFTKIVDFSANDQNALTRVRLFLLEGKTLKLPFRTGQRQNVVYIPSKITGT